MIVDENGNEYLVVDGHAHLGSRPFTPVFAPNDHTAEQLVAEMDRNGVDVAVAFPRGNPHTHDAVHNERVVTAAENFPDRLVAYIRLQPYHTERSIEQIHEFAARGAKGIKLHPYMDFGGTPINSRELIFPLMEAASQYKMAVLVHSGESWNCTPTLIADVADAFPDIVVIVGHCGGFENHQEAIINVRRTPNLYLDTAESVPPMVIRNCVRGTAKERVMFGSDIPSIAIGHEIDKIMKYADLTEDEARGARREPCTTSRLVDRPRRATEGRAGSARTWVMVRGRVTEPADVGMPERRHGHSIFLSRGPEEGSRMSRWDEFLSEQDRLQMETAGFGHRGDLGQQPALLVVDVTYEFAGDPALELEESQKRWRLACGSQASTAVPAIAELLAQRPECGCPRRLHEAGIADAGRTQSGAVARQGSRCEY